MSTEPLLTTAAPNPVVLQEDTPISDGTNGIQTDIMAEPTQAEATTFVQESSLQEKDAQSTGSPAMNAASTANGSTADVASEQDTAERPNGTVVAIKRIVDHRDLPSGVCYDARMRFHSIIDPLDSHPEDPRRIYRIYKKLEEAGLVGPASTTDEDSPRVMKRIPVREVLKEEVLLAHDLAHWESMLATAHMTYDQLMRFSTFSDSVYFNNESAYCARLAAGGTIETIKAVCEGRVKNAFAIVRPPGHHCEPDVASGFCLFNNVAVAVKTTMKNDPSIKKVLILDWDVHHGNGTQTAFYDDPNVLFISIHRYENATFYPGGTYGNLDRCGRGDGVGKNINIPWATKHMGDADYVHAFHRVVMPIAREFNPDLVIISAGFDAALGDPIGECFVTPVGYSIMTYMLCELAQGKVVAVLEGGYNLDAISNSALAVARTLLGFPPARLEERNPSPRAAELVYQVCLEQSQYWRSMGPKAFRHRAIDANNLTHNTAAWRMHDIVRAHQASRLREDYGLVPLPLLDDRTSASFKDQALSTPDFHSADVLVLFIHEAPATHANLSPSQSDGLSLHETLVPDAASAYVGWCVDHGYGVIDVNVPAYLSEALKVRRAVFGLPEGGDVANSGGKLLPVDSETTEGDWTASNAGPSTSKTPEYSVVEETARLVRYLWDNYVDLADASQVVLMSGGGDACAGVCQALSVIAQAHRQQREGSVRPPELQLTDRCAGVIQFYGKAPLRAVSTVEEGLVDWYHNASLCILSHHHDTYATTKKPKRKFGRTIRPPADTAADDVDSLMVDMFDKVTSYIKDLTQEVDDVADGNQESKPDPDGLLHNNDTNTADDLQPQPQVTHTPRTVVAAENVDTPMTDG
ncbi:Histone deacetylase hda1 [Savitreella phatthalungensis]